MGDVDEAHVIALIEGLHQIQQGQTHGYINHTHRLIGYDQLRLQADGAGHQNTLALAAGKLVGILAEELIRRLQADDFHQFMDLGIHLLFRPFFVLRFDRCVQTLIDGSHRI